MDIACFFIGEDASMATSIWKASGWRAEHGLQVLKDKCLVEVQTRFPECWVECHYEPQFIFKMHDHLRDLGREMADKETSQSIDNQMSRPRRLWRPEDLIRMENIKEFQNTLTVSEGKSFRCYGYRYIQLNSLDMKYFMGSSKTSTDLQWLKVIGEWIPEWCPPQNLYSLSLVGVSPVKVSWEMVDQVALKLKELSWSYAWPMEDATEKQLGLFGRFRNLESLCIQRCKFEWNWFLKSVRELTNLQTFKLQHISAKGEFSLSNSGKTIDDQFRMRSLEAIVLCEVKDTTKVSISGDSCPTLKSLFLCNLKDLIEVNLTGVTTLEHLTLNTCDVLRNVFGNDLPNLKIFHLKYCSKMRELPKIGRVTRLKRIYVSRCENLQDIAAIENLKGLKRVWIAYCPKLKSIKAIEELKGLSRIWIESCIQLEDDMICFKELKELKRIFIRRCPSLQSMEGIEFSRCLESIIIARCPKMKNIRGIEELEGLKELIISDSPVLSCVERLQRLPSELTTMVGRSVMPDLELRLGCERGSHMSYFNKDKIADTLSMVDAFCEDLEGYCFDVEKIKSSIHSFQKTHHPLSAFIFFAVVSYSVWISIRGGILYGSRNMDDHKFQHHVNLTGLPEGERIYTCVVTEKMFSNYDWMPSICYTCNKGKAFIMGVKAGEEWKTLHVLQSLFAQLGLQNKYSDYESKYESEIEDFDYDDVADYDDDDEECNGRDVDDDDSLKL